MTKSSIIAKIALSDTLEFPMKGALARYINKEFKGDIDKLRKGSTMVKDLTDVKEYNKTNDNE